MKKLLEFYDNYCIELRERITSDKEVISHTDNVIKSSKEIEEKSRKIKIFKISQPWT